MAGTSPAAVTENGAFWTWGRCGRGARCGDDRWYVWSVAGLFGGRGLVHHEVALSPFAQITIQDTELSGFLSIDTKKARNS